MSKVLNRHEIRKKALQALFSMDINKGLTISEAIKDVLDFGGFISEGQQLSIPEYLNVLVSGVIANNQEIDDLIAQNISTKWTLGRIAKIDLLIIRIAIFEIKYMIKDDVPNLVAIDEAIELTKEFNDEKSSKFVNGILAKIVTDE